MSSPVNGLYLQILAQYAAESYLDDVSLIDREGVDQRLRNGNNHFLDLLSRPEIPPPDQATGGTRLAAAQREEFFATFDIIDHIPNQSSGFSATLLKNRLSGEYTLAFRSTEYRNIETGGDAQRDSVRGAAGDVAFNGMAFTQLSSMEKYWASLLDGTRARGATSDDPASTDASYVRGADLLAFKAAMEAGAKLDVSGYSLGGHLASMFSVFHGDRVDSLYLFNASGVGAIRDPLSGVTYRQLLSLYDFYMQPQNREAAYEFARAWAQRVESDVTLLNSFTLRAANWLLVLRPFLPRELDHIGAGVPSSDVVSRLIGTAQAQDRDGIPVGADGEPIQASSALSFLVSLALSQYLKGSRELTQARMGGRTFPSLQEGGLIPSSVRISEVAGVAAQGAPSAGANGSIFDYTDWNIVADSGIRAARDADLISVYIENQPTAAGIPFTDKGWGDFGTTHSITLIVDSLAVTRMLQRADPDLAREQAEQIMRAASNLRKEHYAILRDQAMAEHDTLERVVDALGRLIFDRRTVDGIDWSQNLASADGIAAYGQLVYRDPLHRRIQAIERELQTSGLAGNLHLESIATASAQALRIEASADSARGAAFRYALRELDPFVAIGAESLYQGYGRDQTLALFDAATGAGRINAEWIADRAAFLALKMRTGMADHYYAAGDESVLYESAHGDQVLALSSAASAGILAPDAAVSPSQRRVLRAQLERMAAAGAARKIVFGAEGDPAQNPATVAGGADRLRGGALADRIYGEGGNDDLEGLGGDDYLDSGPGDDRLIGGPGNDVLAGGSGDDLYLWSSGDGFDRIVEVREADGRIHGTIVVDTGAWRLMPRVFERGDAGVEIWHSPDRSFLLAHQSTWTLGFAGGEIDLGTDLRDGDFGFAIEATTSPPPPTLIDGRVADEIIVGPNRGLHVIEGDYGHDRLYAVASESLDAFLAASNDPGAPGWGIWIFAGPGDDLALGTPADDVLEGGGGDDVLAGGPGNDVISGDTDYQPVDPDPASWRVMATAGHAFDRYVGPAYWNYLRLPVYQEQWREGADTIYGGGGDDLIFGHGGDDVLFGDDGDDVLFGGEGHDFLLGGAGDDVLIGEAYGYASAPTQVIEGVARPHPSYVASYGDDVLDGGAGADLLIGDGGDDVLSGGAGDDELHGDYPDIADRLPGAMHGNDILSGGAGDDLLYGEGGSDTLFGDAGDDGLFGDRGVEGAYHGADLLDGGDGDDELVGGGGADRLIGGAGADLLIGDDFDLALAWHGDDVLDGGAGDDVMYGLGGRDELFGGDGDDLLYGDDPDAPAAGADDVLDGGAGADRLWGHGGNDILIGAEGADGLSGGAGDDMLDGGPGDDVLDGGPGDDTYRFQPGDGVDRIIDAAGIVTIEFAEGVQPASLQMYRVQAPGAVNALRIAYGAGDRIEFDTLVTPQRLRIRIGDSDMMGGAELESLAQPVGVARLGSTGSEALVADAAAASDLFGFDGDDLLYGSALNDRLNGGGGDDEIYGLGGDDVLIGGSGDDLLVGGSGADRLEGGTGNDVYEFAADDGRDTIDERAAQGYDVLRWSEPMPAQALRFRRAGGDLVLAARDGDARIRVLGWFDPARGASDRGVDAVRFADATLDANGVVDRVDTDRTLRGGDGDDIIVGDEFDDILIGGPGNDTLAGLDGDDHYVYADGDGSDRIVDSGGYDVLAFGAGIEVGAFDILAERESDGALSIVIALPGGAGEVRFGEGRAQRIELFEFAGGASLGYEALLARVGGARQEGSDDDDVLVGGSYADALYGFLGNDTLRGGTGADLLVGGLGDDFLAGGANDDSYYFGPGDGRDVILEYQGSDEHELFLSFFTAWGVRAYAIDDVVTARSDDFGAPLSELYYAGLSTVLGGTDTLNFAQGIVPDDIRVGLNLDHAPRPYPTLWRDAAGDFVLGENLVAQMSVVLEIGAQGDAVEVLWPAYVDPSISELGFTEQLEHAPLEQITFADAPGEVWTVGAFYERSWGWAYIRGSAAADVLSIAHVAPGGWLAGAGGDDRYLHAIGSGIAIVEHPGEGVDTVVVDDATDFGDILLTFDQRRLLLDTRLGRLTLEDFAADRAEEAMIERFEFADGSIVSGADVLAAGIGVPGTARADVLSGTSVGDVIDAGAGDDLLDARAGNDVLYGGPGADRLRGGPGRDLYLYLRGDGVDRIEEMGAAGEFDALQLGSGISPAQVSVRCAGDDLVLELDAGVSSITVADWFTRDDMRIEEVWFVGGARWDTDTLAALSGSALAPAPNPLEPAPGETASNASPAVEPEFPEIAEPAPPPAIDPQPVIQEAGSGAVGPGSHATIITPALASDSPALASTSAAAPAVPVDAEAAAETTRTTRNDFAPAPMADPGASAPTPAHGAEPLAPAVLASVPSVMERLAAGGFVSPGRAREDVADTPARTLPLSDVDDDAPAQTTPSDDAMARYWRWMHARLDEHLADAVIDDVESAGLLRGLPFAACATDDGVQLAPARALGIAGSRAFEARSFEGLREGVARLG